MHVQKLIHMSKKINGKKNWEMNDVGKNEWVSILLTLIEIYLYLSSAVENEAFHNTLIWGENDFNSI